MDKPELRKIVKERVENFRRKDEESRAIVEKIRSLDEYKISKIILTYSPLADEVDLSRLLEDKDKTFLFPYIENGEIYFAAEPLERGKFNILEPKVKIEADYDYALCLVPGRAFDKNNNRLGRGKGYYDRYLKRNRNRLFSIGVGFSVQLFDEIPHSEDDMKVDLILSSEE